MPAAHDLHPDFGLLCPTKRLRRRMRIAVSCVLFTLVAGLVLQASLSPPRTLTSALGNYDPEAADQSPQANYRKAVRLTAHISSLVATLGRLKAGVGPIQPDPVLGHAANFLYMLTGERPSGLATRSCVGMPPP